jgi:hypothetical protein
MNENPYKAPQTPVLQPVALFNWRPLKKAAFYILLVSAIADSLGVLYCIYLSLQSLF